MFQRLDRSFYPWEESRREINWDLSPFTLQYSYKSNTGTVTQNTSDDGVTVKFEVPGYGKSDLNLSVDNFVLTLTDNLDEHKLHLATVLPSDTDVSSITSKCENGILTVTAKFTKPVSTVKTIKIG